MRVTPIYIYRTREGNKFGQESFLKKIKVFAVYPRRPKIDDTKGKQIYYKINSAILRASNFLSFNGIPTYYSGPLVSSLDDYDVNSRLFYAKSLNNIENDNDIYLLLNRKGDIIDCDKELKTITLDYMKNEIESNAKILDWESVINLYKQSNEIQMQNGFRERFYPFLSNYKPIIFLVESIL